MCVTLFLTPPSGSVCLGLRAPAVVFVWQRNSHLASQVFFFSFLSFPPFFGATHWPSGICRFLFIFFSHPFFKVSVLVVCALLSGQAGRHLSGFIFGWFVLLGRSLMVASCALVARLWFDIRKQTSTISRAQSQSFSFPFHSDNLSVSPHGRKMFVRQLGTCETVCVGHFSGYRCNVLGVRCHLSGESRESRVGHSVMWSVSILRLLFVVAERSVLFCSVLLKPTNKPPVTATDPICGPLCLSSRKSDHAQPQMIGSGLDQIAADASCDKARLTPSDTKATSQGSFPGIFFFFVASI